MKRLRNAVRHIFNPLHMYCRLKDLGVRGDAAQAVCRAYERYIFRFLP